MLSGSSRPHPADDVSMHGELWRVSAMTEEYIRRGRQTSSTFHVTCPSVVVEFIVSREDDSFGSLDSNKILLMIKSAFLLNNRNSRPHLFIDR